MKSVKRKSCFISGFGVCGCVCVVVCVCVRVCVCARTMGLLAVNCNYLGCASPYFETYPPIIYLPDICSRTGHSFLMS